MESKKGPWIRFALYLCTHRLNSQKAWEILTEEIFACVCALQIGELLVFDLVFILSLHRFYLSRVREENVKDDLRRPDEESSLQKKINELFIKAEKNKNKNNRQIICELNSPQARLEKIMALKTRSTILRSRARWHEQGERNNKYFLNLEKKKPL